MRAVVGVDIGGSSQTAIAYDERGDQIARSDLIEGASGGEEVVEATLRIVASLGPLELDAVGIGIPGQVEPATGDVRTAVNLGIGPDPFPLAARLEAQLGCPVAVENDVRAAALGLHDDRANAGQNRHSLTLVNLGTGISAGVVIDGTLVRGSQGMAGEIGHLVMERDGPLCRCGQRGCLEAIAAGPALLRAWPDDGQRTGGDLFSAAVAGDRDANEIASRVVTHLVTALTWLAAAYDTDEIVIGGGVSQAGAPLLALLREEIVRRAAVSEVAGRRLRPEQLTLVNPETAPGPRGAWVLARRQLSSGRNGQATNKGAAV